MPHGPRHITIPTSEEILANDSVCGGSGCIVDINQKLRTVSALIDEFGPGSGVVGSTGPGEGGSIPMSGFTDPNGTSISADFQETYPVSTTTINENHDFVYLYNALKYIDPQDFPDNVTLSCSGISCGEAYPSADHWDSVNPRQKFKDSRDDILQSIRQLLDMTNAELTTNPGSGSGALGRPDGSLTRPEDARDVSLQDEEILTAETDQAVIDTMVEDSLVASEEETDSVFGISEENYDAIVDAGRAVAPCDDPPVEAPAPECPPCVEDPNAMVPDWKFKEEGDVFFNGKTCEYCVTVDSGETDITILNDTATREAFLEEQKVKGVNLILEYFGKEPLDEASMDIVLDAAIPKEYEVPLRPLLQIRVLVCVPVSLIDSITLISTDDDAGDTPIGPAGCVLKAEEVRTMVPRSHQILWPSLRFMVTRNRSGDT